MPSCCSAPASPCHISWVHQDLRLKSTNFSKTLPFCSFERITVDRIRRELSQQKWHQAKLGSFCNLLESGLVECNTRVLAAVLYLDSLVDVHCIHTGTWDLFCLFDVSWACCSPCRSCSSHCSCLNILTSTYSLSETSGGEACQHKSIKIRPSLYMPYSFKFKRTS